MSDYLPLHLRVEILIRLPVKSLIRCRSVSKSWKSLIDSSEFIADHCVRHIQPERLLIRYCDPITNEEINPDPSYVCFVDDDSFPHQKSAITFPLSVELLFDSYIVGSSHGLLCFHGYYRKQSERSSFRAGKEKIVIWNPSIRKSVAIDVPNVLPGNPNPISTLGFGICPVTSDPMIIRMTRSDCWKVEVYTLSSRNWRTLCTDLHSKYVYFSSTQVVVDGFIYWIVVEKLRYVILSFDMANEKFEAINLPESLLLRSAFKNSISKLWESLVVLKYNRRDIEVWMMMQHGVEKSFTKQFTISIQHVSNPVILGFRKCGKAIMETESDSENLWELGSLVAYEPYTQRGYDLDILGDVLSFSMKSYIETLFLLNW